jgi:hypothetical protein
VNLIIERWARLSAWRVFAEANAALFVGLAGFNLALSSPRLGSGVLNPMTAMLQADPIETLMRCVVFPAAETLVWQAAFVDGFARLRAPRWVPLLLSATLFAVALHWQRGISSMTGAFWFWLVLGLVYASQRARSFWRAFALTTAVHWMPILFMLLASASSPGTAATST